MVAHFTLRTKDENEAFIRNKNRIWRLFRCNQMPSTNRNAWYAPCVRIVKWATILYKNNLYTGVRYCRLSMVLLLIKSRILLQYKQNIYVKVKDKSMTIDHHHKTSSTFKNLLVEWPSEEHYSQNSRFKIWEWNLISSILGL